MKTENRDSKRHLMIPLSHVKQVLGRSVCVCVLQPYNIQQRNIHFETNNMYMAFNLFLVTMYNYNYDIIDIRQIFILLMTIHTSLIVYALK